MMTQTTPPPPPAPCFPSSVPPFSLTLFSPSLLQPLCVSSQWGVLQIKTQAEVVSSGKVFPTPVRKHYKRVIQASINPLMLERF